MKELEARSREMMLEKEEKQRLAAEEPEQYVGAYIYCDADKRIMLYQPDLALDRN